MATQNLTVSYLHITEMAKLFARVCVNADLAWDGVPCWIWTGRRNESGYGLIKRNYKTVAVHRFMYAWLVAAIPAKSSGLELDHRCRRPSCCNPGHLELVTGPENTLRGISPPARNARKTHGLRGHILNGENLTLRRNGRRECLTCRTERRRQKQSDPDYRARDAARQRTAYQTNPEYREKKLADRRMRHARKQAA